MGGVWAAEEPFYEEGDSDYERWFGRDDPTLNMPRNVKREPDGGIQIMSLGFEEPPPFEAMIEIEAIGRLKEAAFAKRNVHLVKYESQRTHNAQQVIVWGANECGQLGVGNDVDQPNPLSCPHFRQHSPWYGRIEGIYAGGFHTFVHLSNPPETLAFGYNRMGQLGLGLMPRGEDALPDEVDPDNCTQEEEMMAEKVRTCVRRCESEGVREKV